MECPESCRHSNLLIITNFKVEEMEQEHAALMPLITEAKSEISERQKHLEEVLGQYGELVGQQEEQSDLVQNFIAEEEALQSKYRSSIKFYEDEVKGESFTLYTYLTAGPVFLLERRKKIQSIRNLDLANAKTTKSSNQSIRLLTAALCILLDVPPEKVDQKKKMGKIYHEVVKHR